MVTGEPTPAAAARGRVLVVDDDAALAEMLTIVLRTEGFESLVCPTGDRALGGVPRVPPRRRAARPDAARARTASTSARRSAPSPACRS